MKNGSRVPAVVAASLLLTLLSSPLSPQGPQRAGQVSSLIPAVDIDRGGRRLVAEAEAPVLWNDVVGTQKLARARIGLDDGSVLNVGSNASLRIVQHDAAQQQTQIDLNYGRVRAKVVRLTRPGAKFEMRTPVATTGAVGTDFFLQQGEGEPAPGPRLDVAVLPFAAGPGVTLSDANTEALAEELSRQFSQPGGLSAAVIAPAGGASPQDAAQAGLAAGATLVALPVIEQAQAKEIQKGFGGFGKLNIPGVGDSQLKHVTATVLLGVQLIRSSDAASLKSFAASSKKDMNGVNVNVAGYSADLGDADLENPEFRKSPLGQALAEAMGKLTAQVQGQAQPLVRQAAGSTAGAGAFHNDVATVVVFEGSVRFCNLAGQCVLVGPGMTSTVRGSQPPDPPHRAAPSVIQDAQQSTEVAPPAPPAAPAQVVSTAAPAPAKTSGPAAGGAQMHFQPFSADVINTMRRAVRQGKVFSSENAIRTEGQEDGKTGISIIRYDRNVMWILVPDQKMYLEQKLGFGVDWNRVKGVQIVREPLGSEPVGPYHCDKSRVRATYEGREYVSIEWAARELNGFVVKIQDEKGEWSTEYRNVRLGPQDPALFEIPLGYRKFTMGGGAPENP